MGNNQGKQTDTPEASGIPAGEEGEQNAVENTEKTATDQETETTAPNGAVTEHLPEEEIPAAVTEDSAPELEGETAAAEAEPVKGEEENSTSTSLTGNNAEFMDEGNQPAAEEVVQECAEPELDTMSKGVESDVEKEHSVEDHEKEKEEGLLCEDKRFDTVLRVIVHGVADITRSTDVASDVDPFVEVRANQVLLGATQAKQDQTTASIEESFYIKTDLDPKEIKLRFLLKDQDHMSDDDLLGTGYFDLAEEDNTLHQTVHLKWKGVEIGNIDISVDLQKLVVVN